MLIPQKVLRNSQEVCYWQFQNAPFFIQFHKTVLAIDRSNKLNKAAALNTALHNNCKGITSGGGVLRKPDKQKIGWMVGLVKE